MEARDYLIRVQLHSCVFDLPQLSSNNVQFALTTVLTVTYVHFAFMLCAFFAHTKNGEARLMHTEAVLKYHISDICELILMTLRLFSVQYFLFTHEINVLIKGTAMDRRTL